MHFDRPKALAYPDNTTLPFTLSTILSHPTAPMLAFSARRPPPLRFSKIVVLARTARVWIAGADTSKCAIAEAEAVWRSVAPYSTL